MNVTTDDFEYISDAAVDNVRCPICIDVYKRPIKTHCGHIFCYDCFRQIEQRTRDESWPCPMCRSTLQKDKEQQDALKTIDALQVRCLKCNVIYRRSEKVQHEASQAHVAAVNTSKTTNSSGALATATRGRNSSNVGVGQTCRADQQGRATSCQSSNEWTDIGVAAVGGAVAVVALGIGALLGSMFSKKRQ